MKYHGAVAIDGSRFKTQRLTHEIKTAAGDGSYIVLTVRYDDSCGNGNNSLGVTGDIKDKRGRWIAGGCVRDEILASPDCPQWLRDLIPFHLCSSDGPMDYAANVIWHAGNRDCWGGTADNPAIVRNGRTGLPCWRLDFPQGFNPRALVDSAEAPPEVRPVWVLARHTNADGTSGKPRDFAAARSCAIWPDATDEQLSAPPEELRAMLAARLPALLTEFRRRIEAAGLLWEPSAEVAK